MPRSFKLFLHAFAATLVLSGCATTRYSAARGASPPSSMQWLYGSGEAASLQQTAYANLVAYVGTAMAAGQQRDVVADYAAPTSDPERKTQCGQRLPAVAFDIDETVILNLGYERYLATTGKPYNAGTWAKWERTGAHSVVAVPGAAEAIARLAELGVTPLYISDRSSENAKQTIEALRFSGIAAPVHLQNLFLKGDISSAPGKDARRSYASKTFCIIALVGDQLGDFSDRLVIEGRKGASRLRGEPWGRGWFILPNPVYGSGVRGSINAVIPLQYSWSPGGR